MDARRHFRSVEGARGVAALGVLTYHVGQLNDRHGWLAASTSRLWLGVPLFFMLSGFLLFLPFAEAIVHGRPLPSFARYGRSRLLRIAPAYWVVLTVELLRSPLYVNSAVAAFAMYLWLRAYISRSGVNVALAAVATAVAIFALAGTTTPLIRHVVVANVFLYYLPFGPWGVLGPAWSLCIEVSFYLALPILVLCGSRLARRAATPAQRAGRLAGFLLPLAPMSVIYLWLARPSFAHVWLIAFIGQFAVGMLLAVALVVRRTASQVASRRLLAGALGVALAANLLHGVGPVDPSGNGSSVLYGPLMGVAFALALGSVLVRNEQTILGRVLTARSVVAAGTVSYGIYLWHFPVIESLQRTVWWSNATEAAALLVVLAATLALATLSWLIVERPALAAKDRVGQRVARDRAVAEPVVVETA